MNSIDELHQPVTSSPPRVTMPDRFALPTLGLRVSERKLLLVFVDLALINLALLLSLALRTELALNLEALLATSKWFVTLIIVWLLVAAVFDVYDLARAASMSYSLRATAPAVCLASIAYLAIPWLTPPVIRRTQAFLFVLIAVGSVSIWRLLYARLFVQPAFLRRSLVVGAGNSGQMLAQALQSEQTRGDPNPFRGTGHVLVGFVDDNPAYQEKVVANVPVLGDSSELTRLVFRLGIDEVIVSITHAQQISPQLYEAILDCREMGIPIKTMLTVYERLTGRIAVDHAGRNVELAAGRNDGPFQRFYVALKRLTDLVGGLLGGVVLIFTIPLVWLGNRIWSPGPLFFSQKRVGRGGRPFTVIKYRSMVPDAEQESGAVWTSERDDRITTFGQFLRKTHLDELPQVINVLRGDMSLVGPRPERPEFVGQLSEQIPFYRARHCLRPGITGWAQIHQNYGDSVEGAKEKLEYDLYYTKHAGPMLDAVIILRTVSKVLGFRGR